MRRTAFSDSALGRTQIFEWIFALKHEENVWESCCPSTGRTYDCAEKVREAVGEDLRSTFTVIAYG
jgi:hypothetical protein